MTPKWNIMLSVTEKKNDHSNVSIYTDIKGFLYQAKGNIRGNLAENTITEVNHIIIEGDKLNVRKGQVVKYSNPFGVDEKYKIDEMNLQNFQLSDKLIDLKLMQV